MTLPSNNRITTADVIAGLSVALILIPQAIAYADIAGMPAVTGLYAASLPLIVAAFFASSRYLQRGPVTITALLTFGALSAIATPYSPDYVKLALLLALIVGVSRIVLGLVGGGAITRYMSQPVIIGFTAGAAVLIIASQAAAVFGITDAPTRLTSRLAFVLTHPGAWNGQAVAMGAGAAAIMLIGRRLHAVFPGVLVAVAAGIGIAATTSYSGAVVGDVPASLPTVSLALPWSSLPKLIIPGVVIAIVGFAESIAIARTMAAADRERWDPDRELISLGAANIAAGLAGGFPVGGSFSRSSLNHMTGAKTRWSGAVTGLAVLAFIPFSAVLTDLPRAVLGATVIVAVARLIRIDQLIEVTRVSWGQGAVAWGTAAATLVLAPRIDLAVLIGVGLAAMVRVAREVARVDVKATVDGVRLTLAPTGVLFYASADLLETTLSDALAAHPAAEVLVVDLERLRRIDYTGAMALKTFAADARGAGLEVEFRNVPGHASAITERTGGF